MKKLLPLLALGIFLNVLSATAADIIYTISGNKLEVKVHIVGINWINYEQNGQVLHIRKEQVSMIFSENGDYYLFENSLRDGFLRASFDNDYYHKLIDKDGNMIPLKTCMVFKDRIQYSHLLSDEEEVDIPLNKVAMILYRDKSHQLFGTTEEIASILLQHHKLHGGELVATTEEANKRQEEEPKKTKDLGPSIQFEKDVTVFPIDEGEFKRKATLRTEELTNYIRLISDKSTPALEANKAIDQAVQLFVGEESVVEVSSINRVEMQRYKIRNYLQHLKLLKYDKVEITWAEVNYVGDIRKGKDGNYYGYVSFVQVFRGFKDGQVMYEDMTEKRVEVMFKGYSKFEKGEKAEHWDVLLSNIKVEQTI
ncbi:MAG: hypothetical protein AAF696_28640 [Bacteroidota bacterium]